MKRDSYSSLTVTKNGYRDQLIYYYNLGIGKKSKIAGVVISKKLICTLEKRYKELGGILPIKQSIVVEVNDEM